MKILVAPNSFKECANSVRTAYIINKTLTEAGFRDNSLLPLSDGGDGFLDVCCSRFNLVKRYYRVNNVFYDEKIKVPIGITNSGSHCYIEVAELIGMKIIPRQRRNPAIINTAPLGELIKKLESKYSKITFGIGGTATSDLGLGICEQFGLKLFDRNNKVLEVKPTNYYKVDSIILPRKSNLKFDAVIDVGIPLVGVKGCNKIFASQKGASPQDINAMDAGAKRIIKILKRDHGINFYNEDIGAGGGLLLGLSLIGNVNIIESTQFLIKQLALLKYIENADLIITGEGNFDKQSYLKKATGIVVAEALKKGKKLALLVGKNEVQLSAFKHQAPLVFELMSIYKTRDESIADFENGLTALTKELIFRIKDCTYSLF